MLIYPVIFTETKDEKDTVLVFIPDLNGMTEGYGLANAISMAKDYIGNALFNKAASEYPKASEIDDIKPETTVFKEFPAYIVIFYAFCAIIRIHNNKKLEILLVL